MQIGLDAFAMVPSTHPDGNPEGLGQQDGVDVVIVPLHDHYLLVAELLDSLPTLNGHISYYR